MLVLHCVVLAIFPVTTSVVSSEAGRASQPALGRPEVNREARLAEARELARLGMVHFKKKEYALARPRLERALTICKEVLGEDDLVTGWHLNVLGCLCLWTDNRTTAEQHFQKALTIFKMTLGEDHPTYVETLSNLAGLYLKAGSLDRARPLLVQVSTYHKMRYGEAHPIVAATTTNLGLLALRAGQHKEAEEHLRQGLMIYRKCYGEAHPACTHTLDLLGQLSTAKKDHPAAESFFREALAIAEKVLPPGDPQLMECAARYAALLRLMGREGDAKQLEEKARTIRHRGIDRGKEKPPAPPQDN